MATIKVGGLTISGNDLSAKDGKVYLDGKLIDDPKAAPKNGVLEIRVVEGVLDSLTTDGNVTAGAVKGNVVANGTVECDCVAGSVTATKGNVKCGRVGGSIQAGGNVRHA